MDFTRDDATCMAKALDWVPPPLVPQGPIDQQDRERAADWYAAGARGIQ